MDTVKVSGASGDPDDTGALSENDELMFADDGGGILDASCCCENDGPSLGRAVLGERKQGLGLLVVVVQEPGDRDLDA